MSDLAPAIGISPTTGEFPAAAPSARRVQTPGTRRVGARLSQALGARERHAVLWGPAGVGKTVAVNLFLDGLRGGQFRTARTSARGGLDAVATDLAHGLGQTLPPGRAAGSHAWPALRDSLRLCRLQGMPAVLVLEDAQDASTPDLAALLAHADPDPAAHVLVIEVSRTGEAPGGEPLTRLGEAAFPIDLKPLTRSEAATYLEAKWSVREGSPIFDGRAAATLHAASRGIPRALDRLAVEALEHARAAGHSQVGEATAAEVVSRWSE